ncbi:alpha/beta hydrolase [Streptomyces sp. NBC_00365]|uniref:alpha/beta hydrolase fold domain-containing protein n=1 Tax=Streptomyces sp. NBC_00365 TaxID=2975726 RepID=UPI002255E716|nr:alpha/beta hydrolase fold domain-containing protein [Streptomyces sp. NBC_00365]MCX5097102.1 alpha/beta hydrolase [Streptomyces sp. NBC_00365]
MRRPSGNPWRRARVGRSVRATRLAGAGASRPRIPSLHPRATGVFARLATALSLNRHMAELMWDNYLGDMEMRRSDNVSPYAAPARAEDLAGLPPTYTALAEFDPLRDEGFAYAQRLINAGLPTELRHFPGASHGVSELVPGAEVSRRMIAGQLDALRRGFHGDASAS